MNFDRVERIHVGGRLCAVIVSASYRPAQTEFHTNPESSFQLGQIVYPAGGEVAPHRHLPLERHLIGTSEAIVVQAGECELALYDESDVEVETRTLVAGDVVVLLDGGHAFRMHEDTVLLEVKQGPYTGDDEKERFQP
jgi:cupin fold WbuC family metalloprotein